MRQIWITKKGGPQVLEVREAPDPEPKEGEVRIKVAAAGVNFADVMARIGLYPGAPKLPAVVGYEVSGTVDKLGPGVTSPAVGTKVLALTHFGGYSSLVCVPAARAVELPEGLELAHGAAIPVVYLTAWIMLMKLGNVQKGDQVLVHAAAGGVGQAALQICKWRGATVIGTASPSKHARLRELGVAHCIDYNTQDFEVEVGKITSGRGVDIVLDAVGGASFRKSYASLAPMGRLFMFGGSGFVPGAGFNLFSVLKAFFGLPTFKPFKLMDKNRGVFGVDLGKLWEETEQLSATTREIVGLVGKKVLEPVIDSTFPFDKVGEAHVRMKERKNFGKILLTP